jgi:hypothetical protein
MFGTRVSMGTSVATTLAVSVITIGAGVTIAGGAEPPPWQKALHARSEALNQRYGLGDRASVPLSASNVSSVPQPDWLRALQLRSEAMNRRYGLAEQKFAQAGTSGISQASYPDWLQALDLRSEAMNRRYRLNRYGLNGATKAPRRAAAQASSGGYSRRALQTARRQFDD